MTSTLKLNRKAKEHHICIHTYSRSLDNASDILLDPNARRCSCHTCFGFLDPPAQKTSNELTKWRLSTLITNKASSVPNV